MAGDVHFRRTRLDRIATRSAPSSCNLRKEPHIAGFAITSFAVNGYLVAYMYRIRWAYGMLRFRNIMIRKWVGFPTSLPVSVKLSGIKKTESGWPRAVLISLLAVYGPQICKVALCGFP